ncbi:phosphoribosyltransferase [Bradyrhizobium sp. NP1]|uniref:phosphoribosyltransferase n=1 Tax=Bradyrhizobium sp. NP1 TaxID=3049772 RepID=UPI0025A67BC6|nr:phosphoribosyltransferase [Bradyrhizobium sp. NP1]WJR74939.1 phosphoribosyltransferase [Bradyrhizobium sp. NP1]
MANLKLISICAYLTDSEAEWRAEDHRATKMVKAVKGDPIKGWFHSYVGGQRRVYDQNNVQDFVSRIPPALAKNILRHHEGAATIVPIPNSHVTSATTPNFKTLEFAQKIAEQSGGQFKVSQALVFHEPQKKSREGGPRQASHFLKAYKVLERPKGPIILFDDVCTTGGHLAAAHSLLHDEDSPVVLACAFGRTTKKQLDEPIGLRAEDLDLSKC